METLGKLKRSRRDKWHKVKFHLKVKNQKSGKKKYQKNFPRASRFIAQVFPLYPTHSPKPPHTWTSGWARRALGSLGAGPDTQHSLRQWAQPPPLQHWECTIPKTSNPWKLGTEKQPAISDAIVIGTSTHPPSCWALVLAVKEASRVSCPCLLTPS